MLLPLLASAVVAAQGSYADVERSLSDGVRARVSAGWAVADVRTENEEFVVTVTKGDAVERHVMAFEAKNVYRVETDAKLPAEPVEPGEFTALALASPRGGIEITSGCGDYYQVPYLVEGWATRETAGRFVAWTLATADDLRSSTVHSSRATFAIERNGSPMNLIVWLDRKGNVIEAQLRRYEGQNDGAATFKNSRAMKKALLKATVTKISDKAGGTLTLGKGIYAINPDGNAFTYESYDGEYEGCGC